NLTTKFCLLLLLAPQTPKKKGTDPPLPQTPAPFRKHPEDYPQVPCNGSNFLKEGTDEKTLVLQPPPGSKDDRKRHRGDHDRGRDRDRDHKETHGPSSHSDAENGNGEKEGERESGSGEGVGAGAGAGAGAEAGAGAGAEAGAAGAGEGETPPPEDEEGTEPGVRDQSLLTQVAYHLTKWEEAYKVLVDNIVEDLRDYWTRLGIPQ
ncbi:^E4, partial [Betapapillomavirus 4]